VPEPGNPQALNRYAYGLNNPVKYNDPSGHDPLDRVWRNRFATVHHREPQSEDYVIRLFSVTFPEEWDPGTFYDAQGNYIQGSLEQQFRDNRPADWTWDDMPDVLQRLGSCYNRGEEELYTRDIGTLFGGLPTRFESPDTWAAVSNPANPVRVWVYLSPGGLSPSLVGTSDRDANVHHWAWGLAMGAAYGPGASLINTVREATQFHGDWTNTWSDVAIGNKGAALGLRFRWLGLSDTHRVWDKYMLGHWFP